MKNKSTDIIKFICNTIVLFGIVGILVNVSPFISKPLTDLSVGLIKLTQPSMIKTDAKEIFTSYIADDDANNITATSNSSQPVMNSITTKDSKDDTNLLQTPSDIREKMDEAEKTISEEDAVGKTSEEAYQGGGTIISEGNIEIQSKIPSSVYSPDIKALLSDGSDLVIEDKSKPTILIYHSHTTEAYTLLDVGYYKSSDTSSKDASLNMVRVGDEIVKYLELQGFNVIHDTEIHDTDYNKSYANSGKSVAKYLEEYPSIEVTIDVHRDDITYSNKTKVKPTAVINDKKAARMMIISGCEYNRVKNFPDWEENLKFDLQVQNKVEQLYPGLMRPILFSERKYNMYQTHYSFLLEVGTDANTLDEACYSARMFAKALGELLDEKYVK